MEERSHVARGKTCRRGPLLVDAAVRTYHCFHGLLHVEGSFQHDDGPFVGNALAVASLHDELEIREVLKPVLCGSIGAKGVLSSASSCTTASSGRLLAVSAGVKAVHVFKSSLTCTKRSLSRGSRQTTLTWHRTSLPILYFQGSPDPPPQRSPSRFRMSAHTYDALWPDVADLQVDSACLRAIDSTRPHVPQPLTQNDSSNPPLELRSWKRILLYHRMQVA